MVFIGIFMMPFYYGSKARSVPEYLSLRFDEKTRAFNAVSFAAMTVMSSGVSMYALAKLFNLLLGWNFHASLLASAVIVLLYIYMGGLTSAIYNEVVQFFLIVLGFVPLVFLGLREAGGWSGLADKLSALMSKTGPVNPETTYPPGTWTSVWTPIASPETNPMGVEWLGMAMGLGFVLSFAYWCTDFLVVQRAMAAESMSAARRTPLIAAFPKMLMPVLVIVPGMIALLAGSTLCYPRLPPSRTAADTFGNVTAKFGQGIVPPKFKDLDTRCKLERKKEVLCTENDGRTVYLVDALDPKGKPTELLVVYDKNGNPLREIERDNKMHVVLDYDSATPCMLLYYLPSGLLGLGLCALMASFMSGMAGNVTAFNTVWTYDIYQSYVAPHRSDNHYLWMGRFATIFGTAISVAAAYVALRFNNIMDLLQLVFGFVNAPLLATFLLGMFWKRTTGHAAFLGLVLGTLAAALHVACTFPTGAWIGKALEQSQGAAIQYLHYRSEMAQNFWTAMWAFGVCFAVTVVVSLLTPRKKSDEDLRGLVYSLTPHVARDEKLHWYAQPVTLALFVLAATLVLNIIFR
jgi:SSS family solute:Na+ symporter